MSNGAPWLSNPSKSPFGAAFHHRRHYNHCPSVHRNKPSCKSHADRRFSRKPRNPKPLRRWISADDNDATSSLSSLKGCGYEFRKSRIDNYKSCGSLCWRTCLNNRFVLSSYNILGVDNAANHTDLYMNIHSDFLRWGSRKLLISQEICNLNADIVCLQEVDRYKDILTNLKEEGYAGSYKRRTGDAKDGCAIFWKEKRFHVIEEDTIEFNEFGLRDNVAQLIAFELSEVPSKRVVVGNIHVLFNPKRGDIKLGQVRMLLSRAHAISEKWGGIPVVLAGDFNSSPKSAIYEFLSDSKLNLNGRDRRNMSGQNSLQYPIHGMPRSLNYGWSSEELEVATGNSKCTNLTHPMNLRSSYAAIKSRDCTRSSCGEPLATTYHSKFQGTVDYMWYSTGLATMRVLDTLPIGTLNSFGGLPCKDIGSDHLSLAAEFAFTECTELHPPAKRIKSSHLYFNSGT